MYEYSSGNSCPFLRNGKYCTLRSRVSLRIHLVTQSAVFFVSRAGGECFPIEYCTCCLYGTIRSRFAAAGRRGTDTEKPRQLTLTSLTFRCGWSPHKNKNRRPLVRASSPHGLQFLFYVSRQFPSHHSHARVACRHRRLRLLNLGNSRLRRKQRSRHRVGILQR